MKSILKVLAVLAVVVAFTAPASADPWKNVENSFDTGFKDNYARPSAISWSLVAKSFNTGFNDNYTPSASDSRVYMAENLAQELTSEQIINNAVLMFGIYKKTADLSWDYNFNRG
jgi:hypothetical protein